MYCACHNETKKAHKQDSHSTVPLILKLKASKFYYILQSLFYPGVPDFRLG